MSPPVRAKANGRGCKAHVRRGNRARGDALADANKHKPNMVMAAACCDDPRTALMIRPSFVAILPPRPRPSSPGAPRRTHRGVSSTSEAAIPALGSAVGCVSRDEGTRAPRTALTHRRRTGRRPRASSAPATVEALGALRLPTRRSTLPPRDVERTGWLPTIDPDGAAAKPMLEAGAHPLQERGRDEGNALRARL